MPTPGKICANVQSFKLTLFFIQAPDFRPGQTGLLLSSQCCDMMIFPRSRYGDSYTRNFTEPSGPPSKAPPVTSSVPQIHLQARRSSGGSGGEDMAGEEDMASEASEAGREGVAGEASEADGEVHVDDAGGEDPVVAIHVVDWRQAGNWSTPGDFSPDLKYPSFQLNISNGLFAKEQRKCGGARFQSPPSNAYMRLVVACFTPVLLPRSGRLWALFSDSFFFGSDVVMINQSPVLKMTLHSLSGESKEVDGDCDAIAGVTMLTLAAPEPWAIVEVRPAAEETPAGDGGV